jgi:mannitol/fructose-specific phosphotransferase system IIA component (Ntr-type)
MYLTDILDPKWIKLSLAATTKKGLIAELIELLGAEGALERPDEALQAVLDREKVHTTGIGHGLALPHGKCDTPGRLVMAIGRTRTPVDFESVDGRPVDLVVLLVGPTARTTLHVQALARIARFLNTETFRSQLRGARSGEELYRLIQRREGTESAMAPDV